MTSADSKIVLVPATGRGETRPTPVVRRYRLARLPLEPRPAAGGRFEHLRHAHD